MTWTARLVLAGALLALGACSMTRTPPPLPLNGPILYSCQDGSRLQVSFTDREARVAIIGGPSMALPNQGGDTFTNGRYTLQGRGAQATWQTPNASAACQGQ